MSYHQNFDEFGQLREDHSPWTLRDLIVCAVAVLGVVGLTKGWFV
jgi:hypothetical protein